MQPMPPVDATVPQLTQYEQVIAVKGQGYFPVMIKLKDSSLFAVIRGGAPHIGIKGRLDWIGSKDGGKTWSAPSVIVDSQWDDRNPAVGQMADGSIVVAYAEVSTYSPEGKFDKAFGNYDLYYVISSDGGKTWSPKQQLFRGPLKGGSPFGKIVVLADGTALMATYGWRDEKYDGPDKLPEGQPYYSGLIRSHDNGRTWGEWSPIAPGYNETALMALGDKGLRAFLRSGERPANVWQAESSDNGRTWTRPSAITGASQHPADAILLQSGHLLLCYGNRVEPLGVQAMLSLDAGKTWDRNRRTAIGWTSLNTDCGYPSSVQLDDGTIVTMYYSVGTKDLPDEQAIVIRYREEALASPR